MRPFDHGSRQVKRVFTSGPLERLRSISGEQRLVHEAWLVIGQYNFNERTATIRYVLPSKYDATPPCCIQTMMGKESMKDLYPLYLETTWIDEKGVVIPVSVEGFQAARVYTKKPRDHR